MEGRGRGRDTDSSTGPILYLLFTAKGRDSTREERRLEGGTSDWTVTFGGPSSYGVGPQVGSSPDRINGTFPYDFGTKVRPLRRRALC